MTKRKYQPEHILVLFLFSSCCDNFNTHSIQVVVVLFLWMARKFSRFILPIIKKAKKEKRIIIKWTKKKKKKLRRQTVQSTQTISERNFTVCELCAYSLAIIRHHYLTACLYSIYASTFYWSEWTDKYKIRTEWMLCVVCFSVTVPSLLFVLFFFVFPTKIFYTTFILYTK